MPINVNSYALTLPEVQKILRIRQTALYTRIANGEIQARRLGGRTVIYRSELERYINAAPVVSYRLESRKRGDI